MDFVSPKNVRAVVDCYFRCIVLCIVYASCVERMLFLLISCFSKRSVVVEWLERLYGAMVRIVDNTLALMYISKSPSNEKDRCNATFRHWVLSPGRTG